MVFGAVEIIALIFAILILAKLLFVVFNPKSWFGFAKKVYGAPVFLAIVELILVVLVFYYLLMSMSFLQIFSVLALGCLLTGLSFSLFAKESMSWAEKILKAKGMMRKAWVPVLVWLILAIWALVSLF